MNMQQPNLFSLWHYEAIAKENKALLLSQCSSQKKNRTKLEMYLHGVEKSMKFHAYYNLVSTKWERNEKISVSTKLEMKNILVWCVQRHAEEEWSYGEGTRLHLQKAKFILCPVKYYINHARSDPETFENRRGLRCYLERIQPWISLFLFSLPWYNALH